MKYWSEDPLWTKGFNRNEAGSKADFVFGRHSKWRYGEKNKVSNTAYLVLHILEGNYERYQPVRPDG